MTIPSRAAYQVTSDTDPPRYAPGYWYTIAPTTAAAATVATVNAIRGVPWIVRSRVRIQALGARVTTGAAGVAQIGIYRANTTTLSPMGDVLANTGDIDVSATGNVNGALVQGIVTIGPGLHWFCYNTNVGTLVWQGYGGVGAPVCSVICGAPTQAVISVNATNVSFLKTTAIPYGNWPDANKTIWIEGSGSPYLLGQFQVAS